jgi:hypothetical protein
MQKMMKYFSILLLAGALLSACGLSDSAGLQNNAQSGSITKFKVVDDALYVLDESELRLFDLADAHHPVDRGSVEIGFGPETLFNLGDVLFVGAQTGMYMFSIEDKQSPQLLSHYEHILSCDPVVANEERAYVTLRNGNSCRGNGLGVANELHILDITDKQRPFLMSAIGMEHPKGLAIDGDLLFVCDGDNGVGIYQLDETGLPSDIMAGIIPDLDAIDVIARTGRLIIVTRNQILQYDYFNLSEIRLLSTIEHGV